MAIHISKLEAACRQLELSIRVFLSFGDPIGIHTLAGAARQLLSDLGRSQGSSSTLDGILQRTVRPEKLKEVQDLIRRPQNFFKHAESDPEDVLEFHPEGTEFLIWDACLIYEALTNERVPLMVLFRGWFTVKHPALLIDAEARKNVLSKSPDPADRGAYLEMLPYLESMAAGNPI